MDPGFRAGAFTRPPTRHGRQRHEPEPRPAGRGAARGMHCASRWVSPHGARASRARSCSRKPARQRGAAPGGTPARGSSAALHRRSVGPDLHNRVAMLAGSELSLLRLMTYRGLWLLETGTVLIAIEDQDELRLACRGDQQVRLSAARVQESALGTLYRSGQSLTLSRPRGEEAAWLHELG